MSEYAGTGEERRLAALPERDFYPPRIEVTIARAFHEAYERLDTTYDYVSWENAPEGDRLLLEAVVRDLIVTDTIKPGRRPRS